MKRRCIGMIIICVMLLVDAVIWRTALAAEKCAEPVVAPKLSVGDKWIWRDEKGDERYWEVVGFEGELAQVKWANPRAEPDREGMLHIDPEGVVRKAIRPSGEIVTAKGAGIYTTIGEKVMDYPLSVGKKWGHRSLLRQASSGELVPYDWEYHVLACEKISTPAGEFSALKIEAEQTNAKLRVSGKLYFWYAPAAKVSVRTVYVPSRYWASSLRDSELIKLELK